MLSNSVIGDPIQLDDGGFGWLIIKPSTYRIHPYFSDMLAFRAVLLSSMMASRGRYHDIDEGYYTATCNQPMVEAVISIDRYLNAIEKNDFPRKITINFKPPKTGRQEKEIDLSGWNSLIHRTDAALFSTLFEAAIDWGKRNLGTNYHQWPETLNFCRVLRNAISHGGRINIRSSEAPRVMWRGVVFDHTWFGKSAFTPNSFTGQDLMILAIDLEHELNFLGAPFELL